MTPFDSNQRIEHEKQQVVQWAKDHIEVIKEDLQIKTLQEVEAMKVHWQEHFRDLMYTELQAAMLEESNKQKAIIGSFDLRHQNQIVEYEEQYRAEMLSAKEQHHQVVQHLEQNAAHNHDTAIHKLRDELALAENMALRQEQRADRTLRDYQEAEVYCRTMIAERDEANIRAENAAGKPNLEISYLRTQLDRTRETHAEEIKELRAACTQEQLK